MSGELILALASLLVLCGISGAVGAVLALRTKGAGVTLDDLRRVSGRVIDLNCELIKLAELQRSLMDTIYKYMASTSGRAKE